jgi:multidrug transporter EmrE-like cation transporter
MKSSAGATRLNQSLGFILLFAVGALFQARGMRREDMGSVYIAVLGLEAVLALTLSAVVLHERLSWQRLGAACLILAGIVILRRH